MPELPEVEFAARHLRKWLSGRRIARVEAEDTRIVRPSKPAQLQALAGHKLESLERRAKYMLLTFDGGLGALSHLGMTGKWVRRKEGDPERFSRLRLFLDDHAVLHYVDMRLFGAFRLMDAEQLHKEPSVAALGPDPLEDGIDAKLLGERLARTKRPLKIALMDQTVIAGLGNIHAAEALYRAKLNPKRAANKLKPEELQRLLKGIYATINHALKAEEDPGDGEIVYVEEGGKNPFLVYDRLGQKCRRCKTPIAKFTQGGRTTYWCPTCQKR